MPILQMWSDLLRYFPIGAYDWERVRGYDGGKKVKGRKRHLLVDTNGLILHVLVHEANIQDYRGGRLLLAPLKGCFPRLELIWADSGYKKEGFCEWVKAELGWDVEIVEHPWSGLRGVWAPKDAVIDWEQIRHRRLSCTSTPLDCRAHVRLAFDLAQAFQRL